MKPLTFDELFEKIRKDEEERLLRHTFVKNLFEAGLNHEAEKAKILRTLMRMHGPTMGQQ